MSSLAAASLTLDLKKVAACARRVRPAHEYKTVIVGAGLGGLVCGAYLARQGLPVTVIEQHDRPGGYATAFERDGGNYRFEVSLHTTAINDNYTERTLENLGVRDKITLVAPKHEYCIKKPDLELCVPQQDPEAYIQILSEKFPDQADGIRGFVREMVGVAEEVEALSRKGMPFKLFFPFMYRKMWHCRNQTLDEMLSEHVTDRKVKAALSALWPYYGLPPSQLSGFYYAVATGGYLKHGAFYIKDRSQRLSDALAGAITEAGGQIIYDERVDHILVEDGSVTGVRTESGRYHNAVAVVSNASAITTFQNMLPAGAVPASYLSQLKSYRPSISTFQVWLGLNQPVSHLIDKSHLYVSEGLSPEQAYQACLKGELEKMGFGMVVYDNIFKGYSQPGTSTLSIICMSGYEPWRPFEADYLAGRKEAYYAQKKYWTDQLIRKVEKHFIPNLSDMIAVREAGSPLTNLAYTGNTDGAIYGFEQSMENSFIKRINNRTPVRGLYLASAWGRPGGGYTGVIRGGEMTFQKMMADWAA